MQDPIPENIDGSKQVIHKVEHQRKWGHVALALGVLGVAYVGYRVLAGTNEHRDKDEMGVMNG